MGDTSFLSESRTLARGAENAEDQVTIGLSFAPDRLRRQRECFRLIANTGNRPLGRENVEKQVKPCSRIICETLPS